MEEKCWESKKMDCIGALLEFEIMSIPETTRFWMIRTKQGYFYNEFIKNKFVAIGWNEILLSNYGSDENSLKNHIKERYGDKRPGLALNKCKNFISEIKEGDILVIPSEGSRKITFARAGKYYEEGKCTTEQEIETIYKIDNKELLVNDIECPYKKRRHVEILKTVENVGLNYHLLAAISSYHGICNFDEYGYAILDCIYDIYEFKNDISLTINVTKKDPIRPREISNLMYGLTEYLCSIVEEESLETAIYLNSPGKVKVALKNIASSIVKYRWFFLILLVVLTGGSVKDAELPGIVKVIEDFKTMNVYIQKQQEELKTQQLENELTEIQIEGEKLQNASQIIEIIEKSKEDNIDIDKLLDKCGILLEVNNSLKLKSNESFSVEGIYNGAEEQQ